MKIQSYLSFKGQCQEALNYYQSLFGGEIVNRQTYEDQKIDIPENYRNKLQHAELKGSGFHIMGYDASPDTPITDGTSIQMSIDMEDDKKGKKHYLKSYLKVGKSTPTFKKPVGEHITVEFPINMVSVG